MARSANYPFIMRPPFPDHGLLREGKKMPPKRKSNMALNGTPLARALWRAGYKVPPNGGVVEIKAEGEV